MRVFGLAAWSGSGKTTLVVRLVPELVRRGLTVSTMKHAHHGFDVDQPGKDSYRHREAGATEVLVASSARWALMHEQRGEAEPSAAELMRHMTPVDLLIVEGFKREGHDKLEIHRPALGKPLLYPRTIRISWRSADATTLLCTGCGRAASSAPRRHRRRSAREFHHRPLRACRRFAPRRRSLTWRSCPTTACRVLFGGDRLLSVGAALARMLGASSSPWSPSRRPVPLPPRAAASCASGVIAAPLTMPPHDNAAVDGYAVHFAEDLKLADAETRPAGRRPRTPQARIPLPRPGPPRAARPLRIFTGALMPAGPDTVVMQEDCRVEGERPRCLAAGHQARRQPTPRRRGRDAPARDACWQRAGIVCARRRSGSPPPSAAAI